jgi:peptide/nickel transport system ATP-binding protein
MGSGDAVLEVRNLSVDFALPTTRLRAVDNVSFTVYADDVYALVGESGCGKSTLAAALLDLVPEPGVIASGDVLLRGTNVRSMTADQVRRARMAQIAMVFQAAMSSFNPVVTIGSQVEHVLEAHPEVWPDRREGLEYFDHLLEMVRLPGSRMRGRFESQLSGGMKQRVAIAFACVLKPSILVLDEPTTALDVVNQRLVIDVLKDLREKLGVTVVFVTHDLSVVAELATMVAVMYAGRMVQIAPIDTIFYDRRRHPYVQALLSSIPNVLQPGRAARSIPGQVPRLDQLPPGCRFAPRCPLAEQVCLRDDPELIGDSHHNAVACHPLNRHNSAADGGQELVPGRAVNGA